MDWGEFWKSFGPLVGIVVGFTLKALYDSLTRRHRDRREDERRLLDRS